MAGGLNYFDMFQTDCAHLRCQKIGGMLNIGFVLRQSADAGDAQQIFEFGKESRLILPSVFHRWGRHADLASFKEIANLRW
jgi:hypothetical protein